MVSVQVLQEIDPKTELSFMGEMLGDLQGKELESDTCEGRGTGGAAQAVSGHRGSEF
jgi:hypothetical protein